MQDESTLNLLDKLDAVIDERLGGEHLHVAAPYRPDERADVAIVVRRRAWRASAAGEATLAAIAQEDDTAALREDDGRLLLRFTGERLAALGRALEIGGPRALPTRDLAAGQRWAIDFCDPNASKALHVGHLRNVAFGHALASLAAAAGADVVRQSHVSDFGRSMGEALAGYLTFAEGETPASLGVKGDVLVGDCYARYVRRLEGDGANAGGDPALSREDTEHHDLAEDLLVRWRAEDPEVRALWRTLRQWAVDGQHATLARLGIRMDRTLYESDFLAECGRVLEDGLAAGVVSRGPRGETIHATGDEQYPAFLLGRADGFPTQHLRYVAMWRATIPLLAGARSVAVLGDEWRSMAAYADAVLRGVEPDAEVHPSTCVKHGMVTAGEEAVKSSAGTPRLIDTLLDELERSPEIGLLCERHPRGEPAALARLVALGYVLGRPMAKLLSVTREELLAERGSAGWTIAQAWARASDAECDGPPDPDADDPDYRFAVVQSQLHRRHLRTALERLDALGLVKFHASLAQWFLATDPSPRTARVVRTVLRSGATALGLLPNER